MEGQNIIYEVLAASTALTESALPLGAATS